MSPEEQAVSNQLIAYNQRDLEAFCNCYSQDILITFDGSPVYQGIDTFRANYKKLFDSSPHLFAEIIERKHLGQGKIRDLELVKGRGHSPEPLQLFVTYHVHDALIQEVHFETITDASLKTKT